MCSEPQFSTHEDGRWSDALSGPSGPAGDDPLLLAGPGRVHGFGFPINRKRRYC